MGRLRWTSWVLPVTAAMLLVSATTPAFAQRCKNLRLEVDPPNPDESSPVTVTVAAECSDACLVVCDVTGEWISSSEFSIHWYIRDKDGTPDFACAAVRTTQSSDLPLGPLTGREYDVTGTMHITPWDGTCTEGTVLDNVETTFRVDPVVPAVSEWGLVIMTLSILAAGTILLRRRVRYLP